MTGIQVTSPEDRPTREEQIQTLSALVADDGVLKLRFPIQMYDEEGKQYPTLREAQWTINIPKASLTPTLIEEIVQAVGVCIKVIGERGPQEATSRVTAVMS